MKSSISDNIVIALKEVMTYTQHINDWMVIKKEMLKILPPQERKKFSTRDPITKLQSMNEFEIELMKLWNHFKGETII